MRRADQHQHQRPDILQEIKSEGAAGSQRSAIMRGVYSLSTSIAKVMKSGKTDCRLKHRSRPTDRHKGTDSQTEPHTKRLVPCSSIWPGQIRLQHSGIYQAPQYRCITWTAERSPSHFLIAYSICVCVCVCVWISVSNTSVLIFPFICECLCVCMCVCVCVCVCVCLCATALPRDPPQGRDSSR